MSFETALRATEILLALAFLQHSAEHLVGPRVERLLFGLRMVFCLGLLGGITPSLMLTALAVISLIQLHYFQGAYNGGSDRMGLLILWCTLAAHLSPNQFLQEAALGYLALQLTLSYFISGRVKIVNPDWRTGQALQDVFAFSAYPVSEDLRALSHKPNLLLAASWAVISFEILFPIALISQVTLIAALTITTTFHFANAALFGLNRFVWIWVAAYPSLLWLQGRILQLF